MVELGRLRLRLKPIVQVLGWLVVLSKSRCEVDGWMDGEVWLWWGSRKCENNTLMWVLGWRCPDRDGEREREVGICVGVWVWVCSDDMHHHSQLLLTSAQHSLSAISVSYLSLIFLARNGGRGGGYIKPSLFFHD